MIHYLKLWPVYYYAIHNREKTFEIRKKDRDYNVGDILILREYLMEAQEYTGQEMGVRVTYITEGLGVQEGYCIMGIKFEHE